MEIPTHLKTIDWPTSIMWFDEDGVLYSKSKPGIPPPVSKEESLRQMEEFKILIGGKPVCMILETASNSKPPNKEERDFAAEQLNQVVKAMGIITTSPLSRMVANLFFGLKPPPYPVRFFQNEKEAKEWIKKYL